MASSNIAGKDLSCNGPPDMLRMMQRQRVGCKTMALNCSKIDLNDISRKDFLTVITMRQWNKLLGEIVESPSLEEFQGHTGYALSKDDLGIAVLHP